MALCEINMNQNVKTVAQALTTEQKGQARTNIGAGDAVTLAALQALVEETFADMFLVREYTATVSIAASGTTYKSLVASEFTPAITDIEGYTRVGVIGFSTGSSLLTTYRVAADAPANGTTAADAVFSIKNISSSAAQNDKTVKVKVLFVKTSLLEATEST